MEGLLMLVVDGRQEKREDSRSTREPASKEKERAKERVRRERERDREANEGEEKRREVKRSEAIQVHVGSGGKWPVAVVWQKAAEAGTMVDQSNSVQPVAPAPRGVLSIADLSSSSTSASASSTSASTSASTSTSTSSSSSSSSAAQAHPHLPQPQTSSAARIRPCLHFSSTPRASPQSTSSPYLRPLLRSLPSPLSLPHTSTTNASPTISHLRSSSACSSTITTSSRGTSPRSAGPHQPYGFVPLQGLLHSTLADATFPAPQNSSTQRGSLQSQNQPPSTHEQQSPLIQQWHSSSLPGTQPQVTGRLPISRLKRDAEDESPGFKAAARQRVSHACEPCRQRKTRCTGERPVCSHCRSLDIACNYTEGKRDREKRSFQKTAEKLRGCEELLRDLQARVNGVDSERIARVLDQSDNSVTGAPKGSPRSRRYSRPESDPSGSVGSVEDVDQVPEDLNRSEETRATGYLGKNADVIWLARAKAHRVNRGQTHGGHGSSDVPDVGLELPDLDPALSVSTMSYHLDEAEVIMTDVEPYFLPPPVVAKDLLKTYIATVHSSFPIIGSDAFVRQYQRFLEIPQGRLETAGLDKWLAVLNMLFAIAAVHCHLTRPDWDRVSLDHLVFFNRARKLAVGEASPFNHPDLRQIQVYGLMAYYFVSTDQINRAWMSMGSAFRACTALGLHLRNDSPSLADKAKEMRYRMWWALFHLEAHLCVVTGRQGSLVECICTTPLPVPYGEDDLDTASAKSMMSTEMQKRERSPNYVRERAASTSGSVSSSTTSPRPFQSDAIFINRSDLEFAKGVPPNKGLFNLFFTQLCRISQDSVSQIYTPKATQRSWHEIQTLINNLDQQLESWKQGLPHAFQFSESFDRTFLREQLALGFLFYGIRITVHRPCLCRLTSKEKGQSEASQYFNAEAAKKCLMSATALLDLLPQQVDTRAFYKEAPWATLLHHLMQATSILLLEISLTFDHNPDLKVDIYHSCGKAVLWLHALAVDNAAARKAWAQCNDALRELGRRDYIDLRYLPTQLDGYRQIALPNVPMDCHSGHATTYHNPLLQQTQQPIPAPAPHYPMPTAMADPSSIGSLSNLPANFFDSTVFNPFDQCSPLALNTFDLIPVDTSPPGAEDW